MFNENMLNNFKIDEETIIGNWNNKPLYTMVKKFHLATTDQTQDVVRGYTFSHNIPNIETCVKIDGYFYDGSRFPYIGINRGITSITHFTREEFVIRCYNDTWDRDIYMLFFYTKTTD